jgi:branched-chain amino acid transport system ATP-binding protein
LKKYCTEKKCQEKKEDSVALLEVKGLSKDFGGLTALDQVDLEVESGQILGLIGPNGAGKTTLFNVVSGFLPPTRGKVIFKGRNITGWKPHNIASIGLIRTFQATALFKKWSVFENVLLGRHLMWRTSHLGSVSNSPSARREADGMHAQTMELLEDMGLAYFRDEPSLNLPQGYQRVLGIAIAMACKPDMVLLDEPATGMNPEETANIMKLIRTIRDRGTTILLVEHTMRVVMGICEKIVVLSFGRKIAEGTPEEVKNNSNVIAAYLGTGDGFKCGSK